MSLYRPVLRLAGSIATALAFALPAHADGRACELVTPEELVGVMGGKPALKPSILPNGVEVCTGKAAGSTVTIQLFPKSPAWEEARDKTDNEHEKLQKMGAIIESRKFMGVNCTSIGPGGKAARQPYTTACTASKGQRHATLELKNPSLSLAIKDVAAIADRIGSRFWQL